MKKQTMLELFEKPTPKPDIVFAGLSLHEKINYKANKCGFSGTVYLSKYNYYHYPIRHRIKTDGLSADYFEHYALSAGFGNRIDRWRKQERLLF
jgi:hypothetical protein